MHIYTVNTANQSEFDIVLSAPGDAADLRLETLNAEVFNCFGTFGCLGTFGCATGSLGSAGSAGCFGSAGG